MRKIAYSLAIILLLTACNSKSSGKSTAEDQTKQEVMHVNEALLGKWQGMIEIPQAPLEIILNLEKSNGNMSVPAQGLSEFPFETVRYNDSDVDIQIDLAGSLIKIAGVLKDGQIGGTFTQNGQSFPSNYSALWFIPLFFGYKKNNSNRKGDFLCCLKIYQNKSSSP